MGTIVWGGVIALGVAVCSVSALPQKTTNDGIYSIQDVPWITTERRSTYILSMSALAGYDVAREVVWTDDAPWPGPDRLLVLKRQVPH